MVNILSGRAILSASTAEDMVFAVNILPVHTCTKSWQNKGFMYSLWWFRDYKLTTWARARQCIAFNMIQFLNVNKTSSIWTNGLWDNQGSCERHVNMWSHMSVLCCIYMIKWRSHDLSYLHYVLCIQALPLPTTARRMVPPYKLMPIWECRRFWNLQDRMDGTCQAPLVAKQGSGNVVKVRDGPWLKILRVACEVDSLSLYIIVHRNRLCWEHCSLTL